MMSEESFISGQIERSPSFESDLEQRIGPAPSQARLRGLLQDEEVREARDGLLRTVVNGGITLGDLGGLTFLGIPEAGSIAADFFKGWTFLAYRYHFLARWFPWIPKVDLTPDVPVKVAYVTELAEFCSFGHAPTHGAETAWQLAHDAPRMWRGLSRAKEIWQETPENS